MKKYNIISVFANYDVKVVGTWLSFKDALDYLNSLIADTFQTEDTKRNFRVYNESKSTVSVYQIGYFSKYFLAKYYVVEYDDTTSNE